MKNPIFLMLLALLVLLISSFASAYSYSYRSSYDDSYQHSNELSMNDNTIFVLRSQNSYDDNPYDWENPDRYPTYDYRNGYSYRNSPQYQGDRDRYAEYWQSNSPLSYPDYGHSRHVVFQKYPYTYYTYNPYMRYYEERECYVGSPTDKLIYTKCP